MKKLLSLLLVMAMLLSVTAFAETTVNYTFKAEDGTVYHFGTFDAADEDAGLVINDTKYSLKGGSHECDDANCENAYQHAKNNGLKFGMGIKLADVYEGTTYTMAPYSTVSGVDSIKASASIDVTNVDAFPEVEEDTDFDTPALTFGHVGWVSASGNIKDFFVDSSTVTNIQQQRKTTGKEQRLIYKINLNGLKGINDGTEVILRVYGYWKGAPNYQYSLGLYGTKAEDDKYEKDTLIAAPIKLSTEAIKDTKCEAMEYNITEYIKKRIAENSNTASVVFNFEEDNVPTKDTILCVVSPAPDEDTIGKEPAVIYVTE